MNKFLSIAVIALGTLGLSLAVPAAGYAQPSIGVRINVGVPVPVAPAPSIVQVSPVVPVGPVVVRAGYAPVYPINPPAYVSLPPVYGPPVVSVSPSVIIRPGPVWFHGGYYHGHGRHR